VADVPTDDTSATSIPWAAVDGVGPPAAHLELNDLALLSEVVHPLRSRIMRRLKEPRTVAQVADGLDMPVTRLYHHVNRLEAVGLIRVVATRKVAAVTERQYQVSALSLDVAEELFTSEDPADVALALGSLFDLAKLGLQREVEHGDFSTSPGDSLLSMGDVVLSADRRRELIERLQGVIAEFCSDADDDEPGATRMTLFVSAVSNSR
jgi:DNA-binding transcriptional ArsR family regulator